MPCWNHNASACETQCSQALSTYALALLVPSVAASSPASSGFKRLFGPFLDPLAFELAHLHVSHTKLLNVKLAHAEFSATSFFAFGFAGAFFAGGWAFTAGFRAALLPVERVLWVGEFGVFLPRIMAARCRRCQRSTKSITSPITS